MPRCQCRLAASLSGGLLEPGSKDSDSHGGTIIRVLPPCLADSASTGRTTRTPPTSSETLSAAVTKMRPALTLTAPAPAPRAARYQRDRVRPALLPQLPAPHMKRLTCDTVYAPPNRISHPSLTSRALPSFGNPRLGLVDVLQACAVCLERR